MKNLERWIRYGLIVMVILSLYFSFKIWTSPSNKELVREENQTDSNLQNKSSTEIFLPAKVVWHTKEEDKLANSESLISTLHQKVKEWNFETVEKISVKNAEKLNQLLKEKNTVEFIYSDLMGMQEYNDIYQLGIDKIQTDVTFNRVVISLVNKELYFLDLENYIVYSVSFEGNTSTIVDLLRGDDVQYMKVSNFHDILPYVYYMESDLQLKKYSYISATQSYTMFTRAFFDDLSELHPNEGSKDISYSDNKGNSLVIHNGIVSFKGKIAKKENTDSTRSLYMETYDYVRRLGTNFGNIKYFDLNDDSIIYQNYVEGFPVFASSFRGEIQINVTSSYDVSIQANEETIQVPIPSEEEVFLENTEQVLAKLLAAGVETEKIIDLQIGYTWENIEDTKQIVDLNPEWYIKYDGSWLTVNQLLVTLLEKGEQ